MRTLKEQLGKDALTFLNPKEFGEEITVNGVSAFGCWDEVEQPAPVFFGASMDVIGVNTVERVLFVMPKADDHRLEMPVPDQELNIDGAYWTVRDAKPEGAITKLTLYRNES